MAAAAVLGLFNAAVGAANQERAREMAIQDQQRNYFFGEMEARNADIRTRALYNDFYSPAALMKQYKEAGLSPSLMFSGTPGQGGSTGQISNGAYSNSTPYMPISLLEGMQVAAMQAEIKKTEAETKNIESDTDIKGLQKQWDEWRNLERGMQFDLVQQTLTGQDGKATSLFEIANESEDYDGFLKQVRASMVYSGNDKLLEYSKTEIGQKELRKIFMNANIFDHDIRVLSEEGVSADFQKAVLQRLNSKGFAEQNASTIIEQLKSIEEASKLTVEQKGSWNRVLDRLRKKNSTAADILIVVSMIMNQAMQSWKMPTIK